MSPVLEAMVECLAFSLRHQNRLLLVTGPGLGDNCQIDQALHWGCYMGRSMVVELLLRADADIDFRDGELRTPLHRAVQQSHALHLEIIMVLLARGAEVAVCARVCFGCLYWRTGVLQHGMGLPPALARHNRSRLLLWFVARAQTPHAQLLPCIAQFIERWLR